MKRSNRSDELGRMATSRKRPCPWARTPVSFMTFHPRARSSNELLGMRKSFSDRGYPRWSGKREVKFFTLAGSIALHGGQIIHRYHGKRAHADDERALIDEKVGAVVRRGFGNVLTARHDTEIEIKPGHLSKQHRDIFRRAGTLIENRVAIGCALQHRHHARGDALVVHGRVVQFDDIDLGLGVGAVRDIFGDLLDVAMDTLAHPLVVGTDGASHLDAVGDDVPARATVNCRDTDYRR